MGHFNYVFNVNENEIILHKAQANMQDEQLIVHGALYLTSERLVFVGYVPNTRTKVQSEVSLYHVQEIRPGKTFFFIENIIRVIDIRNEEYKFIVDKQKIWLAEIYKQLDAIGQPVD
jgi:hypothetical protein